MRTPEHSSRLGGLLRILVTRSLFICTSFTRFGSPDSTLATCPCGQRSNLRSRPRLADYATYRRQPSPSSTRFHFVRDHPTTQSVVIRRCTRPLLTLVTISHTSPPIYPRLYRITQSTYITLSLVILVNVNLYYRPPCYPSVC